MFPFSFAGGMTPPVPEGSRAVAGTPLARENAGPVEEYRVIDSIRTVHDPEIPVNVYDLGLIYDIERLQNGDVHILMSLTAPACPVAGEMPQMVADAVAGQVPDVGEVAVTLTWDPPWTPERMSEDARMALGF